MDDGRRDPVPALRVDSDLFDWAVVGADVRLRVSPLLHYAHSLEVRRDPQAEDQAPDRTPPAGTIDRPAGEPDAEPFPTDGGRSRARHTDPVMAGIPDPRSLVVPDEAAAALPRSGASRCRSCPAEPVPGDCLGYLAGRRAADVPRAAGRRVRSTAPTTHLGRRHDPADPDSTWWPLGTARSPRDVPGLGVQARFYGALLAALHPRAIFAVRVHRHGVPDNQATVALAELAVRRLNARRDRNPAAR